MTDKQIIIDGCDVSGCELYREDNGVFAPDGTAERTELCYLTNDYCANNPNCDYKQYKRSEAQCEGMFVTHTDLEKKYKAKEQECEELKEILKDKTDKYNKLAVNYDAHVSMANNQFDQLKEQLKAKEQECERLKVEAEKWESAFTLDTKLLDKEEARANKLEQQLDQLKADNDSLKSELMQTNCYLEADKEIIDQLKAEVDELKRQHQGDKGLITATGKMNYQLLQEYDKLKAEQEKELAQTSDEISKANSKYTAKLSQTLEEIKEIAEEQRNGCDFYWSCEKCTYYCYSKQILQKISEVKE